MKFYEDEKYIKMCGQAEEIQNIWVPDEGDYCYDKPLNTTRVLGFHDCCNGDFCSSPVWNIANNNDDLKRQTFLPRQDQLREMSGRDWGTFDIRCYEEHDELGVDITKELNWHNCSKEIAGLIVVMKEKYNKTWNGEEWV